jgi:two-component system cell cycle sensor histidine kinase/response regulator CckA
VAGEIAHDINNVLSLIFGHVELALSELPEGARARADLEMVLAAGDRAKELVSRILAYSNRTTFTRERISISNPVRNGLKYLADRTPPNISVSSSFPGNECFVFGNEAELTQIITNLFNNSVQAMPPSGGSIDISISMIDKDSSFFETHSSLARGNHVLLTVHDTGLGMDPETLEKMYTPFFTSTRGNSSKTLRAGLGLTTVYNIVATMNGFIFARSSLGKGSTFEICLPQLIDATAGRKPTPVEDLARHPKRVLFIDDEPAITEMASHILGQSGYKALFFIDGNEALEYFTQHPHDFDIIITDLKMPRISGSELASRCAALNPDVPIILTSGFSEKISLSNCRQWGVTTVITKPFSIGQLLSTLEDLTR